MRFIPTDPRERGRWWSPFLAGAAAGLLASLLLRRGAARPAPAGEVEDDGQEGRNRWRDAWDDAVEGASEGLASARELLAGRNTDIDLEGLRTLVEGMECATECRVRLLGEGIVEVVGTCGSDEDARVLLDRIGEQPGVEVVVNRVWTPGSDEGDDGG